MAILLIVFETLADARSSSTLIFIRVTVAHAATETIENRPHADLQKNKFYPNYIPAGECSFGGIPVGKLIP